MHGKKIIKNYTYGNLLILLDLERDVKSKTHLTASNKTNFL